MTKEHDDWFDSIFRNHLVDGSDWTVPGVNFMTPEVLGYVEAPDGSTVEISAGYGYNNERIYGITFNRGPDDPTGNRNHVAYTLKQVYADLFELDS